MNAVNVDDSGIVCVVVEIRLDEVFRLGVDGAGRIHWVVERRQRQRRRIDVGV